MSDMAKQQKKTHKQKNDKKGGYLRLFLLLLLIGLAAFLAFRLFHSSSVPDEDTEQDQTQDQQPALTEMPARNTREPADTLSLDELPLCKAMIGTCKEALGSLTVNPAILPPETTLDPSGLYLYGNDAFFTAQSIPDSVFARMEGVTFPVDCPVTRDELRYLRLLYVDADGQVRVGEMVVNHKIAEDVCSIFRQLYEAGYPIERIRLADDYGGDDEASMEDDNTSAFNCRPIEGSGAQSRHSFGMAIDINTLYNPYYMQSSGVTLPVTAGEYIDRNVVTPYTIQRGDLCYKLFAEHGFTWGGDWTEPKDYQHFEK